MSGLLRIDLVSRVVKDIKEKYGNDIGPDHGLMRHVVDVTSPHYGCLRPPGPAGAAVIARRPGSQAIIYGYVEPPTRSRSCKELGECEMVDGHCVRCVHAERSAILTAAKEGYYTKGAIIYSILKPCYECTKEIIAAGIMQIYYAGTAYDEERTTRILNAAYVRCERLEIGLSYGK